MPGLKLNHVSKRGHRGLRWQLHTYMGPGLVAADVQAPYSVELTMDTVQTTEIYVFFKISIF